MACKTKRGGEAELRSGKDMRHNAIKMNRQLAFEQKTSTCKRNQSKISFCSDLEKQKQKPFGSLIANERLDEGGWSQMIASHIQ
jgi:hypothetical protein